MCCCPAGSSAPGLAYHLDEASRQESLRNIDLQYLLVAAAIALIALMMWRVRARLATSSKDGSARVRSSRDFCSGWAIAGAATIFLYVGAEVTIGSLMINFLGQDQIFWALPQRRLGDC